MSLRTSSLLILLALAAGCSGNSGTICDKRQECFNSSLDTGKCEKTIDAWADESRNNEDRVAECADCVSDNSCSRIIEKCIDDCLGIP